MMQKTIETLGELEGAEWFAKVGVCDTDAAVVLKSWAQALRSSSSGQWRNMCLEAANQYAAKLREISPQAYSRWNDVVAHLKPVSEGLVDWKLTLVVGEYDLPQTFVDRVRWDTLHLLIEAEFANICSPGFYASQGYWYVRGHFPCGWHGEFPNGKIVIF